MKKRGETHYILDPRQFDIDANLAGLAKRYGEALEKHYPGWFWLINPDPVAGCIFIYSLRLSGEWGYIIKTGDFENVPDEKIAAMAGGEILDRYNIRRGKYDPELLRGKIQDLRGNFVPDITDKLSKDQKKIRDKEFTKAVNEGKAAVLTKDMKQPDGTVYRQISVRIGEDDGNGSSQD